MQHLYGFIDNGGGTALYYQSWSPAQPAIGVILIVHGLCEHSGRYTNLVKRFVAQGYVVFGFDHQGHGLSEGEQGDIGAFADYVAGLEVTVNFVHSLYRELPLVLYAHGMGGLVSLHLLASASASASATVTIDAVVLSGPMILTPANIYSPKSLLQHVLSYFVPQWRINPSCIRRNGVSGICRHSQVVDQYQLDPLVNTKGVTGRLLKMLLSAMAQYDKLAPNITVPVLILQGSHDDIVAPDGATKLTGLLADGLATLKIYQGLYHELLNELEREVVLNDIEIWLDNVLGAEAGQPQSVLTEYTA